MTGLEIVDAEAERGPFHLGPVRTEVAPGEAVVLLGPSGAGKTTLLRATAGFLPLQGGEIRFDGAPYDRLPPERRRFGFVPPDLGLFAHRRVRGNVAYPLELRGAQDSAVRTRRWLERFDLSALADRYPNELSSGERQRVAIARALAAEPRALLWDEPLGALDVESRETLVGALRELLDAERIPLLLVTHDASTAFALASRLVVLEGGRVRFDGPPQELPTIPLDRFTARFLGFENLFSRGELERAVEDPLGRALLEAAGPDGVAVPAGAVRWSTTVDGLSAGTVSALRWSAGGWSVTIRRGELLLRAATTPEPPPVRAGDRVGVEVDGGRCKPLLTAAGEALP